jgi:hypothetical protein
MQICKPVQKHILFTLNLFKLETKKSWFGLLIGFFFVSGSALAQPAIDLNKFKGMEAKEAAPISKKDSIAQLKKKKKLPQFPLESNYDLLSGRPDNFYRTDTANYNNVINYSSNPISSNTRFPGQNSAWINLGEPGSPGLLLSPTSLSNQMEIGLNPIATTLKTAKSMRFYKAKAPLSLLKYTQGNGRTFVFDAIHTQNFSPTWNVTLDYKSQLNEDLILGAGQNNTQRNTQIGSNYLSKNGKFSQFTIVTWNRLRRNEYGGLNPSALNQYWPPVDSTTWGIRSFGPFESRLSNPAKSFYGLNSHLIANQYAVSKTVKITQESVWEKTRFQYADTKRDTNFYGPAYYHYDKKINDSSYWKLGTHKIGVQLNSQRNPRRYATLNWTTQRATTESLQPNFSGTGTKQFRSSAIQTNISLPTSSSISNYIHANYTVSGYNQGAYEIGLVSVAPIIRKLKQELNQAPIQQSSSPSIFTGKNIPQTPKSANDSTQKTKSAADSIEYIIDGMRIPHFHYPFSITFKALSQRQSANLFDHQFYSNHFQYNNNFSQIGKNLASLHFTYISKNAINATFNPNEIINAADKKRKNKNYTISNIEFQVGTISNPILRLNSAQPSQWLFQVPFTAVNFSISQKINHFQISQLISFKSFKSDSINNLFNYGIPQLTSLTDVHLEYYLFKKTMRTRIGLNAWYISSFTPVEYRPDALSFYYNVQQTNKSGNYLQLDAYLTAQIQSAIIYFKLEHFNELNYIPGFNPRYDFVTYYPIQPYRFRVGVQWKFYN